MLTSNLQETCKFGGSSVAKGTAMDEKNTLRARSARGIAAAAIVAGLMAAPLPALADEAPATQTPDVAPVATVEAATSPSSDLAAAQKEQVAAQDAVTNAQNDVSSATAAEKAAEQDVAAAQDAQASAHTAAEAAQAEADATKSATDAAQSAYDDAEAKASGKTAQLRDAADAAKSDLEAAKEAESQAQADAAQRQEEATAANNAATTAKSNLDAAKDAATKAQEDASAAQKTADSAAKTVATTKAVKDAADAKLTDTKAEQDSKQAAYDSADAAYQSAVSDAAAADKKVEDAQAAEDAAKSDLDAKQAAHDTTASNLSAAQAEKTAADAAYTAALAEKTAADAALAEARKAVDNYSKGSYGYFESRGDSQALKVLTDSSVTGTDTSEDGGGKTFLSYTNLGADNDATSLENMKRALDFIKEGNDIRTGKAVSGVSDGADGNFGTLPALKVSSYLMAIGQVNANWMNGRQHLAHAIYNGENELALENAAYSSESGSTTNLSGYDPYEGWYKREKAAYDNLISEGTTDPTELAKSWSKIGHYCTLMSHMNVGGTVEAFDFVSTGFGCAYTADSYTSDGWLYNRLTQYMAQEFSRSNNDGVDFDTYYNDFMTYYNGKVAADKSLAAAKTRVANAESALTAAATRRDKAATALSDATSAEAGAKSALDAATTKEAQTSAELASAKEAAAPLDAAVKKAKTARDAAGGELDTAKTAYQAASAAASSANVDYQQAVTDKSDADAALATAKADFSAAQQAQDKAQTAYDAAQEKATQTAADAATAQTALAAARADTAAKQAKYDTAEGAYEQASQDDATLKAAKAALDAAKEAQDEADAKLAAAQSQLTIAEAASKQAQTNCKAAQAQLATAKAALKEAEDDLTSANARLAAAQDAWKRATATQELYRLFDPHSGEHLYTTHPEEVDALVKKGWDWEQAQTMLVPVSGAPVWRLFDPHNGDHHYTTDANECRVLTTEKGWLYDFNGGAAFHSADKSGRPVYRIYDTHAARFGHLFTADANERAVHLREGGWDNEGIAWYAVNPATLKAPTAPKPSATSKAHYAVRYDANGGVGYMKATVAQVGTAARLSTRTFSRSGYRFQGWSTAATNKSVAYADGATASGISAKDGDVISLFAVWKYVGTPPTAAQLAQLKQAAEDARAQADQSAADLAAAQKARDAAQVDADAKSAAERSDKTALEKAKSAVAAAQKASDANTVADAQAKVDAAQKAYDQAVADASAAMTSTQFLDGETDGAYTKGYNDINAAGKYKVDGTGSTYEDLVNACDMMDEVNSIRTSLGLTELKVDPYLVFVEVLEADINDVGSQMGHSTWQRSKSYSWGDLAWGYGKTSAVRNGWYGEKAEFDEFIKEHPTVTSDGKTYDLSLIGTPEAPAGLGYAFSVAYPEEFPNVGHYLSLVSTNSKYMGGGFATKSNTAALLMGNGGRDSTYTVPQTYYTVSEWRAKVQASKDAYESAQEKVAPAQQALDDAKANLATAQDLAKKASDAADEEAIAQSAYDQSASAANVSAAKLASAEKALATAKAKDTQAKITAQTAQTKYQNALEAYEAAQ